MRLYHLFRDGARLVLCHARTYRGHRYRTQDRTFMTTPNPATSKSRVISHYRSQNPDLSTAVAVVLSIWHPLARSVKTASNMVGASWTLRARAQPCGIACIVAPTGLTTVAAVWFRSTYGWVTDGDFRGRAATASGRSCHSPGDGVRLLH